MNLETTRKVIRQFVDSSKEFKLTGPEGFEDLVGSTPETETHYFKQIEMTEHGPGQFGLLLYVYSQDLDESVVSSTKFEKLLKKSAKAYDKQNVKLARDGNKFFLGVGLLDDGTDLLRVLTSFSKLTQGVRLFEYHLNKKLRLSLSTKN